MKFLKLNVTGDHVKEKGLHPIELERLGSFVALCGRNGSGKSRILDAIVKYFSALKNEDLRQAIPASYGLINMSTDVRSKITNRLKKRDALLARINNRPASSRKEQMKSLPEVGIDNYIKIVTPEILQQLTETDTDNQKYNYANYVTNNDEIHENEFVVASRSAHNFIKQLCKGLVKDDYLVYRKKLSSDKSEATKMLQPLKDLVKKFLNKDLSWTDTSGDPTEGLSASLTIDGFPFSYEMLSPGERVLFKYCLVFYILEKNSNSTMAESIIIIDEPELHLHPEAQIKLVNGIKNLIGETGQCLIATHSINILAHLSFDEIFMVKDNRIIPPKRTTPGKTLIELMGLDGHIKDVSEFMVSITEWAYSNFLKQCFTTPDVIESINQDDPQVEVFKKSISEAAPVNLLDFGAGKGRVGIILHQDPQEKETNYYAQEQNEEYREELRKLNICKGIYAEINDIPNNTFSHILICNVLHEIHPNEWVSTFHELNKKLKKDGFIIIVEDQELPIGEKPNEVGFLILNSDEINILFKNDKITFIKHGEDSYSERILCALINKKDSKQISSDSVIAALEGLENRTFLKIKDIKKNDSNIDVSAGRKYGFYSQLHLNAKVGVEILKG